MIPTIFVVGVLGIGALMILPKLNIEADSDNRTVIVTVSFTPTPRTGGPIRAGGALTDVVTVQLEMGSTWEPKENVKVSPKVWTLHPSKAQRIRVEASQFTGELLSCTITEKGREPVTDAKAGPTEVACVMPGLRGK